MSIDTPQAKPRRRGQKLLEPRIVIIKERSPDEVEWLEESAFELKEKFKEKSLARFLKNAARYIYGTLADSKSFRQQAEKQIRSAPWVVHWVVPLEIGGAANEKNMVVVLQDTAEVYRQRIATDCEAAARSGSDRIEILHPTQPVLLPMHRSRSRLPLANDDGDLVELVLPLDRHSREAFKKSGLWDLGKKSSEHRSARTNLLHVAEIRVNEEEIDDAFAEHAARLGKPNRIRRIDGAVIDAAKSLAMSRETVVSQHGRKATPPSKPNNIDIIKKRWARRDGEAALRAARQAASADMPADPAPSPNATPQKQRDRNLPPFIAAARAFRRRFIGSRPIQQGAAPRRPWYVRVASSHDRDRLEAR